MAPLINAHNDKMVITYNIPTEVDASSGQCFSRCVDANATLTLALPKKAQPNLKEGLLVVI